MKQAHFRFFAELNDFLLPDRRDAIFTVDFSGKPSVKHLIEALGVPHPEVGPIWVNHALVDFSYHVQDGDQIAVYPATLPADSALASEPRFVLDNHLGKLATYLRILGFDVLYSNGYQDDELARIASREGRILLTRDRHLLMRSAVVHGYCVRALEPEMQIAEVLRRFDLSPQIKPFNRCLRCNHPLQPVEKQAILHRLEPLTKLYYDEFRICPACDRIYWKGSHYQRMQRMIEQVSSNS